MNVRTRHVRHVVAVFMLFALTLSESALSQHWPAREIKLYVPLSAGSSVDTLARAVVPAMAAQLKQSILVENRPGAEGAIASDLTRKAPADGYTLMVAYPGHALNVTLYPNLPYDALKDFTPIALIATNRNALVVRVDSPIKSVSELITFAKSNPDKLSFGNGGGTSGGSGDLLNLMAGIQTAAITYKGAAEAQNDLLGGRLDFMFTAMSTARPMVADGRLRALALTGTTRHPKFPDLPNVAETVPGYETSGWYGLAGPSGLPKPIVDALISALHAALQTDAVQKRLAFLEFDSAPKGTSEEFNSLIRSEIKKWAQVLKPRN
ncbi:MAG: tripartite tricarboxylate transporter substrate-binding protein [Alcaligenaceae bacterium]